MKKLCLFLSILVVIILSACNNNKDMTTTIINGEVIYNGIEEREISLKSNDEISIEINKNDGIISINITSIDKKEYFYKSNDLPTSSFKVGLEAGDYIIIVDAYNFNGSYSIK